MPEPCVQRDDRGYASDNIRKTKQALNVMLEGLPPAITEELHSGAVDQQVQRPIGAPIRDPDSQ